MFKDNGLHNFSKCGVTYELSDDNAMTYGSAYEGTRCVAARWGCARSRAALVGHQLYGPSACPVPDPDDRRNTSSAGQQREPSLAPAAALRPRSSCHAFRESTGLFNHRNRWQGMPGFALRNVLMVDNPATLVSR